MWERLFSIYGDHSVCIGSWLLYCWSPIQACWKWLIWTHEGRKQPNLALPSVITFFPLKEITRNCEPLLCVEAFWSCAKAAYIVFFRPSCSMQGEQKREGNGASLLPFLLYWVWLHYWCLNRHHIFSTTQEKNNATSMVIISSPNSTHFWSRYVSFFLF